MYPFISPLSLACMLLCLVGIKDYGLCTQSLGLDWPLSEVGTGLEQQICLIPHRLIIWAYLPSLVTKNKQQQFKVVGCVYNKSHSKWIYLYPNIKVPVPTRYAFSPQNGSTSDCDSALIYLNRLLFISKLTTTNQVDTDVNNDDDSQLFATLQKKRSQSH